MLSFTLQLSAKVTNGIIKTCHKNNGRFQHHISESVEKQKVHET